MHFYWTERSNQNSFKDFWCKIMGYERRNQGRGKELFASVIHACPMLFKYPFTLWRYCDSIPASMGLAWESQKCFGSWHCDWQQRKDAKSCHTGCFQMTGNLTKIYFSLVPFLGRPFIDYLLSVLQWNEVRVFKDSPENCFQLIKVHVAPECVLFLPEKYQVTL